MQPQGALCHRAAYRLTSRGPSQPTSAQGTPTNQGCHPSSGTQGCPQGPGLAYPDGTKAALMVGLLGGVEVCGQRIPQEPDLSLFSVKAKCVSHHWDYFPNSSSRSQVTGSDGRYYI